MVNTKTAGRRQSSRNSNTNSDGVNEPPVDQWSHVTHATGPTCPLDIYDYPINKHIKVVAIISSTASHQMIDKGYTCTECGSSSRSLAVGSLNKGGRLSPFCIDCFVAARDDGPPHLEFNKFHLSPWLHAQPDLVEELRQAVDNTCNWMPRRVVIKHQLRKVGSMGSSTSRPMTPIKPGGCSARDCSGCSNVNDLLEVWVPEVTPWYKKIKPTESEVTAAKVIQNIYRHHIQKTSVKALLVRLKIFVAKIKESIGKLSHGSEGLLKLARYQELNNENLDDQAKQHPFATDLHIFRVLNNLHLGRAIQLHPVLDDV